MNVERAHFLWLHGREPSALSPEKPAPGQEGKIPTGKSCKIYWARGIDLFFSFLLFRKGRLCWTFKFVFIPIFNPGCTRGLYPHLQLHLALGTGAPAAFAKQD